MRFCQAGEVLEMENSFLFHNNLAGRQGRGSDDKKIPKKRFFSIRMMQSKLNVVYQERRDEGILGAFEARG